MSKSWSKAEELENRLRYHTRRLTCEYEYQIALLHREVNNEIPKWANAIVKTLDLQVQFAKINSNGQFLNEKGDILRGCTETCTVIYMKD